MTDISAASDGGAAPADGALLSLADMEAAAAAEERALDTDGATDTAEGADAAAEKALAEGEAKKTPREPLPPEEVERRWRATKRDLATAKEDLRALRGEVTQLRSGGAQPAQRQAPAAMPDPDVDPVGAIAWIQNEFKARQEQEQGKAQQEQEFTQRHQAQQQFVSQVQAAEEAVRERHPDFDDAVAHLKGALRDHLLDLGVDEEEVDGRVSAQVAEGVVDALRQGLNPAAVAYKLAVERGYTKKAPLDQIAAGAAAAKSLSQNGGGRSSPSTSDEAQISRLSGQALRDYWAKVKNQNHG